MTTLTIDINTDNDAFFDHAEHEISNILKRYADRILNQGTDDSTPLFDTNGNHVGNATITD